MFGNFFKNTSKSLKRVSLALRALVGTVAAAAYIQSDVRLAFWFLVAGAVLDFIIQLLPPDTEIKSGTKILAVVFFCSLLWMGGCRSVQPLASSINVKDTTTTKYTPIDVPVKGAIVNQYINVDSLFKAYNAKLKQYVLDSINAVNAGKPLPSKPAIPATTVSDPQTKAQLSYWIDQFGKLQVSCESKDQTVQILVAENNRLRSEVKTVFQTDYKTPTWNYIIIVLLGVALVITLFKR